MGKKKILVCGATGFIGRNVAEYFSENEKFEVFGTYNTRTPYNNNKIQFIKADLTKPEEVKSVIEGKDILINAAAVTSGSASYKAERDLFPNIIINSNVIKESYDSQIEQMIFLSCSVMYPTLERPVKEEDSDINNLHPRYYSIARMKVFFEDMCRFLSQTKDNRTRFIVVRHSNIYGPHDKFDIERAHIFGATINRVTSAPENGNIIITGTGEEERDLLYISDLVNFFELSLKGQKSFYEIYNVGYGSSISVKGLVGKIIEASEKNLTIVHDKSKESNVILTKLALNSEKAMKDFGWKPKVSLEEGIKRTMEWYNKNLGSA